MIKKVLIITLLGICVFYIRKFVIENRRQIGDFIDEVTPPKYSSNNPKISTVSYPYHGPSISDNDTEEFNSSSYFTDDRPPPIFEIDDTESLRSLNLACQPEIYGYTVDQGNKIFPHHGYPKCPVVTGLNQSYIYIDTEQDKLYMNCPGDYKGRFLMGPTNDKKLSLRDEIENFWQVWDYEEPEPVDEDVEFALGTCDSSKSAYLIQAHMNPQFNKTAYDYAKARTVGKPKIIFMLTLDSMSRRHFFRKMPKTIDFLNSLNQNESDYWAFDFKLHNILGPNSVGNQVPIFGGKDRFVETFEGDQNVDYIGEKALWNILREKGYISLFGLENCDNYFPKSLGRKPNVDYAINQFFCAVYKYTDYKFDKEAVLKQRCLGAYMTHYYPLNYTYNLAKMNQGVNMWLYLHLNGAHEATGLHAETMDDDVMDFVKKFFNDFGKDNDIIMFLHADHGMRYGNWYKDLPAYQENKLPGLFLIAGREFIEQYDKAYSALTLNTQRLTSKMDLRKTTLYLAGIKESTKYGINLFEEVANKGRTCEKAGIEPWDCSCREMKLIEEPDQELKNFILRLADQVQATINTESYASEKHDKNIICEKIEIKGVEKAYNFQISNVEEFFKLEMTVKYYPKVKFQANILVSSQFSDRFKYNDSKYNVEHDAFRKAPIMIRILNISRLDKYAGPCELKAIQAGLRGDTCICKDGYKKED